MFKKVDFSSKTYKCLLKTLQSQGFLFLTYHEYVKKVEAYRKQFVVLRHDVESRYDNALRMAYIEHELGIKGSFYFRIYPVKKNSEIIKKIAALGHEIGYHYDDLSVCKGNHSAAIERFQKNLTYLRQFAPVTTITMEGAPLSKFDNRNLWSVLSKYDSFEVNDTHRFGAAIAKANAKAKANPNPNAVHYSQFDIIAEPYFDLNFNEVFYLTDTGRRWDGHLYNVRDKATKENPVTNPEFLKLHFHSTQDIIDAVNARNDGPKANGQKPKTIFPDRAMLNFHPQRWNDKPIPWIKELILQNIKNQGKRLLVKLRN